MLDLKALLAKILKQLDTPLKVASVSRSIGRTAGSHVGISAPTVSGYTFLCWLSSATSGWVSATYISEPMNANSNIWSTTTNGTGTGTVIAYALYVKTP